MLCQINPESIPYSLPIVCRSILGNLELPNPNKASKSTLEFNQESIIVKVKVPVMDKVCCKVASELEALSDQ